MVGEEVSEMRGNKVFCPVTRHVLCVCYAIRRCAKCWCQDLFELGRMLQYLLEHHVCFLSEHPISRGDKGGEVSLLVQAGIEVLALLLLLLGLKD